MPEISRHAVVERGAQLDGDVRVGPFSYIGEHVRLGPGCIIENNATVTGKTTLAARNHIFPMAIVGAPAGEAKPGEPPPGPGQCIIGEANVIREHVTIYAGTQRPTTIGRDNLIMIGCQIGPGAVVGNHEIFANCTHVLAGAVIEDYVRSSAFPVVEPGVRVGAYTFISGYARLDQDAPPFAMVQGQPFRVRGVNTQNLRRCGFGEDDIRALKSAFRELFDGVGCGVNSEALRRLHDDPGVCGSVRRLLQALQHAMEAEGHEDG